MDLKEIDKALTVSVNARMYNLIEAQEQKYRLQRREWIATRPFYLTEEGVLSPRYEYAIRLKMIGWSTVAAAKEARTTGKKLMEAYTSKEGVDLQRKVRGELDNEFKNLQILVLRAVEKGLKSEEPQVFLGAANLWFKAERETKLKIELTAEDIIKDLLEKRREEVNVGHTE